MTGTDDPARPEFWHVRWQEGRTGFHQAEANALLRAHLGALGLARGARIFLPLCGKTRDIGWLLDQGHSVAGVELSEIAVAQLFDDLGATPEITDLGKIKRYSIDKVDIFTGDVFDLGSDALGPVDAIYDRAALVALPREIRGRYADHLARITSTAPQILICFEYDQSRMQGPPYAIDAEEVARLYGDHYTLTDHAARDVEGGFKGKIPATERVWLLR